MFDAMTMSSALSSVKAIYDLLKGANDGQLAMRVSSEVANIHPVVTKSAAHFKYRVNFWLERLALNLGQPLLRHRDGLDHSTENPIQPAHRCGHIFG